MVSLQSPHRTTQQKPKKLAACMWHASDLQTLRKGCCRWMKLVLHVMKNLGRWFRVQPPSEMIAQFNPTSSGNSKFGIGSIPWNNLSSTEYHAPWLQGLKASPCLPWSNFAKVWAVPASSCNLVLRWSYQGQVAIFGTSLQTSHRDSPATSQ